MYTRNCVCGGRRKETSKQNVHETKYLDKHFASIRLGFDCVLVYARKAHHIPYSNRTDTQLLFTDWSDSVSCSLFLSVFVYHLSLPPSCTQAVKTKRPLQSTDSAMIVVIVVVVVAIYMSLHQCVCVYFEISLLANDRLWHVVVSMCACRARSRSLSRRTESQDNIVTLVQSQQRNDVAACRCYRLKSKRAFFFSFGFSAGTFLHLYFFSNLVFSSLFRFYFGFCVFSTFALCIYLIFSRYFCGAENDGRAHSTQRFITLYRFCVLLKFKVNAFYKHLCVKRFICVILFLRFLFVFFFVHNYGTCSGGDAIVSYSWVRLYGGDSRCTAVSFHRNYD